MTKLKSIKEREPATHSDCKQELNKLSRLIQSYSISKSEHAFFERSLDMIEVALEACPKVPSVTETKRQLDIARKMLAAKMQQAAARNQELLKEVE